VATPAGSVGVSSTPTASASAAGSTLKLSIRLNLKSEILSDTHVSKALSHFVAFLFQLMIFSPLFLTSIAFGVSPFPVNVPTEVACELLPFLTLKDKYSLLISHRMFRAFQKRLQGFADLESEAAAVDYFWSCNQGRIEGHLKGYYSKTDMPLPKRTNYALGCLSEIAKESLASRRELVGLLDEHGCLQLSWKQTRRLLNSVGLLGGNLMRLDLSKSDISDIRPLLNLGKLRSLNLVTSTLKDLSKLATLVSLEHLDLTDSAAENVNPLSSLTNLVVLELTDLRGYETPGDSDEFE